MKALFDTLVRIDNQGKIIGVGAESWTTSADGLIWTFKLRPQATWTDGKPVLASDFVYAWQRIVDPKTASQGAELIRALNLVNTDAIIKGEKPASELGVKTLDDYTLELTLNSPTPWLLETLTFLNTAPVRKDIVEKYGVSWTRPANIVSNGPYKLVANNFNESLIFDKRDDYWDAPNIYITQVKFVVIKDNNAKFYNYLAGNFMTVRIPVQLADIAREERPEEIVQEPYPSTYAIILNTNKPEFKDPKVRRALSLLVDREILTAKVYKHFFPTSIVAPAMLEDGELQTEDRLLIDPQLKTQRQEEAIRLLTEAGYSKEKPLSFEWSYHRGSDSDNKNIALSEMLRSFSQGIVQPKLKSLEKNIYYTSVFKKDFDVVYYIMNPDYYHVSSFLKTFLPDNVNNFSSYDNPKFTKLYYQASNSKYAKERAEIYQQMNLILQQEAPVIPVMLAERFILKSPALGGFNGKLPYTYFRDYYIISDKSPKPSAIAAPAPKMN